jgi:indole-3-glycerol phosphate synthase
MSILKEILRKRGERLQETKRAVSLREVKSAAGGAPAPLDFAEAVRRSGSEKVRLIAEIKKASPSKGVLRKDFDHAGIAQIYEEKNVDAVSVLTEEDYFMGSVSFLEDVRHILTRPVLRKDFIIEEYQIYESRARRADAILVIAAAVEKGQASEFLHLARELGMDVLYEVHSFRELETALSLGSEIIGINNRDLETLSTDLNTTFSLKSEIPSGKTVISESGIRTIEDVRRLQEAGIDAMLIGTAFMESPDIGLKIDALTYKR